MPLYPMICKNCGKTLDVYQSIHSMVSCKCQCGSMMVQAYSQKKVSTSGIFHQYYDYGLGEYISSNKQRKQIMKQQGVIEVGNEPNWKKYVDKRKNEIETRQEKEWAKTINKEL